MEADDERLVLTGVRLIDGTGSAPVDGVEIHIAGDKIEYVGAATSQRPPAGKVIDLGERTVLPGLINAHEHLAIKGFDQDYFRVYRSDERRLLLWAARSALVSLAQGVTSVRDAGAHAGVVFSLKTAIDDGVAVGSRVHTCGQPLQPSLGNDVVPAGMTIEVADTSEIVIAASDLIGLGADFVKMKIDRRDNEGNERIFTPDELRAAFDVAWSHGRTASCHALHPGEIDRALEAGADVIEHGIYLSADNAAGMALSDTVLVPCLASWSRSPMASEERITTQTRGIQDAIDAGVTVAVGTDLYASHIVDEMEALVALGLTPGDAITAASRSGARALGIESTVGTVEAGMLADLVVVDEDPLTDLSALRNITSVVLGGRMIDPAAIGPAVGKGRLEQGAR